MLERLFSLFISPGTYEERKVAYFEMGNLHVSTAAVVDGALPFETGVRHPEYNEGAWVIVDAYETREEAEVGHGGWVATMTEGELPDALFDVANNEIAKMLVANGVRMVFPRGNRSVQ